MSVFLTSVRSESFERHRLVVVVILILPDVVAALCAAPAAVAQVGHDHTRLLSQQKHPKLVQHWHDVSWVEHGKVEAHSPQFRAETSARC